MSSRSSKGVIAGVVVLFLLAPFSSAKSDERSRRRLARVERIIDGDTLVVSGGAGVRPVQIDAPEAGEECYASESTAVLVRLARRGALVELEEDLALDRVDRYGRLLRYVHSSRQNVNVELVRRGAATPWFYDGDRGRYATRLLGATSAARAARRGMWGVCRVSWRPDGQVATQPR